MCYPELRSDPVLLALKGLHCRSEHDPTDTYPPRFEHWVVLSEVPSDSGHRIADYVAVRDCQDAYAVGYELKTSRWDFLGEMAHPEKRRWVEETCRYCCFLSIGNVIQKVDVPEGWGLIELEVSKDGLSPRTVIHPPMRSNIPTLSRWLCRQLTKLGSENDSLRPRAARLTTKHDKGSLVACFESNEEVIARAEEEHEQKTGEVIKRLYVALKNEVQRKAGYPVDTVPDTRTALDFAERSGLLVKTTKD